MQVLIKLAVYETGLKSGEMILSTAKLSRQRTDLKHVIRIYYDKSEPKS